MSQKLKITNICVGCDSCRIICPEETIFTQENEYFIENWGCTLCSLCIQVCPVDAIKTIGSERDGSKEAS